MPCLTGRFFVYFRCMKKIRITNKKVFISFVLVLILFIGSCSFFIFEIVESRRGIHSIVQGSSRDADNAREFQGKKDGDMPLDSGLQNSEAEQDQRSDSDAYNKYENQYYGYSVNFPLNWYLNSDSSETKLEDAGIEGRNIMIGGQTLLSNYKNIDDYSPDQKPDDFHLLGLTIYESSDTSVDDLASVLGFDAESILKRNAFDGNGISGTEFVAVGADEKNPLVMIIFPKNQRFYVFNLGFINGDTQAAEIMENIAKTFNLK